MATTNTPTTLASRYKEVYADGITNLVPKSNQLVGKRLKFKPELSPGEKARFDVQLELENGFSTGQGEITLSAAVAGVSEKAEVEGYSIILRSRVSYDAISRAKDSKKAFAKFNDQKFIPMVESFRKREEILAMYGRDSLGKVSANGGSGVLTISADTWCPALWLGLKGQILEAFTAKTGGSQHDGNLVVSAIDVANRTVTVTGTSSSVVANDYLFFKPDGASNHRVEPYGLMAIARNTGSLYNISATTYELWKANSYDVGTSGLTLAKVLEMASKAADKGCDEDMTCMVPTACFQRLVSDQAALRDHGANYNPSKMENGAESLVFHGATGKIEIVPYMFMKQGECLMFPERYCYLIGSQEMSPRVNDRNGDIVFDLESVSAQEMRLFAEWTVFCERPGWLVYGTRSDAGVL